MHIYIRTYVRLTTDIKNINYYLWRIWRMSLKNDMLKKKTRKYSNRKEASTFKTGRRWCHLRTLDRHRQTRSYTYVYICTYASSNVCTYYHIIKSHNKFKSTTINVCANDKRAISRINQISVTKLNSKRKNK